MANFFIPARAEPVAVSGGCRRRSARGGAESRSVRNGKPGRQSSQKTQIKKDANIEKHRKEESLREERMRRRTLSIPAVSRGRA
jgi:hypothetical protein